MTTENVMALVCAWAEKNVSGVDGRTTHILRIERRHLDMPYRPQESISALPWKEATHATFSTRRITPDQQVRFDGQVVAHVGYDSLLDVLAVRLV